MGSRSALYHIHTSCCYCHVVELFFFYFFFFFFFFLDSSSICQSLHYIFFGQLLFFFNILLILLSSQHLHVLLFFLFTSIVFIYPFNSINQGAAKAMYRMNRTSQSSSYAEDYDGF